MVVIRVLYVLARSTGPVSSVHAARAKGVFVHAVGEDDRRVGDALEFAVPFHPNIRVGDALELAVPFHPNVAVPRQGALAGYDGRPCHGGESAAGVLIRRLYRVSVGPQLLLGA
jgi:hypothetical protein